MCAISGKLDSGTSRSLCMQRVVLRLCSGSLGVACAMMKIPTVKMLNGVFEPQLFCHHNPVS